MADEILSRNRFVVHQIGGLASNCLGWTFFTVEESPYLANHYVTEWRMGVTIATQINNRLFVFDSEGIAFGSEVIEGNRTSRDDISRLFPEYGNNNRSAITRISAHSLDMSDRSIRSISSRTRSFADTFSDLLDSMMIPATISGHIDGVGRHLGLSRSNVAEDVRRRFPIRDYITWLEKIDSELSSSSNRSKVFDRFAQLGEFDPEQAKTPTNILLDLTVEAMDEFGLFTGGQDSNGAPCASLAYADLCADISKDGIFEIKKLDGTLVQCSIKFDEKTKRYKITSAELNALHQPTSVTGCFVTTLTQQLNVSQAFRVLTPQLDVVYVHGEFLKTRDIVSDGRVLALESAYAIKALKNTISEKGEKFFNTAAWHDQSIFGLTDGYVKTTDVPQEQDEYYKALQEFHLILLDDGGDEIGDFLCIGQKKLVLVHAKASSGLHFESVTELQAVGRQAIASLAFCSTAARAEGIKDDRWERKYTANDTDLEYSRVMRNSRGIPHDKISDTVRRAMQNPSISREVWIVVGRLIDIDGLREKAKSGGLTNHRRQLLMYIDALTTACARANAKLLIFGS